MIRREDGKVTVYWPQLPLDESVRFEVGASLVEITRTDTGVRAVRLSGPALVWCEGSGGVLVFREEPVGAPDE